MLYPHNLEQKLGFGKIRVRLAAACESTLGQEYVRKIKFYKDRNAIEQKLVQTSEFVQIIQSGGLFPNAHYTDIRPYLKKAAVKNAFLTEEAFFDMMLTFKTLAQCLIFFKKHQGDYPELATLAHSVLFDEGLPGLLNKHFDDRGQLHDRASEPLYEIRKGIAQAQRKLRKVLDGVLRRARKEGYTLEDVNMTIRDGRMVIPVLAEHKRRIQGFVHGESATGQTVYLEPAEVLEVNNEVKELQYAEKREVIRILTELTDRLRPEIPNLSAAVRFLGLIDFIRAKARFAIEIEAIKPQWKPQKGFDWQQARHPILQLAHKEQGKEVVPLDIRLDSHHRVLLISGPNAGGKSVCLKTVGLLQYMFQCGLLVPTGEASEFGLFRDLFIDIGDEQSIENDLSTYSSHLVNMKQLLALINKDTLFLIDEFGTGTEPQFGGAIAESILNELKDAKGLGIITTHYGNLKSFAEQQQGLVNGAMKYDINLLQPLYELEIGKPGSSFALEIAQKIGLPKATIERAKSRVGAGQVSFDQLLGRLESEKQEINKAGKRVKTKERELRELTAQYEELKQQLEGQQKEIIRKAKVEANALVAGANRQIERVIRQIREEQADKEKVKTLRQELDSLKKEVQPAAEPKPAKTPVLLAEEEIETGSYVKIKGQETVARVTAIKGKDAELAMGGLTSIVKINRLEKTTRQQHRQETPVQESGGISLNRKMADFSARLDIRGYRAEEVIPRLDQYLDEALLLGQSELHILHGKGNGVLRQVVRTHLKTCQEVSDFRDEHADRGGAGVTIVSLRDGST